MTTIAHVRQIVQPLLQRHADLALIGRYLLITPVHHFTRGIIIDRGSDPKLFVPSTSVSLIFDASARLGMGWGTDLAYFSFEGLDDDLAKQRKADPKFIHWMIDNLSSLEHLVRVMDVALDTLRSIITLDQMIAFCARPENNPMPLSVYPYARLLMAVAISDLDQAIEIVDAPLMKPMEIRRAMDVFYPTFYPALVAHDRQELARILHELEAKTVKNLKYGKVWEPTPFPLEL
jgi:hypothetical protein